MYDKLLARISREFLKKQRIYKYRGKCVGNISDSEIITCCHYWCEDNGCTDEFTKYREATEREYVFCSYVGQYVEPGACYNMQMACNGFDESNSRLTNQTDKEKMRATCLECENHL